LSLEREANKGCWLELQQACRAGFVRRRIKSFFPIFLLALLVQFYAPVGARLAMAAQDDPRASAPICTSHTSDNPAPEEPAAPGQDHES
jgi:hypothetical protein